MPVYHNSVHLCAVLWAMSTCGFTEIPFPIRTCAIKAEPKQAKISRFTTFSSGIAPNSDTFYMAIRGEKCSPQGPAMTHHLKCDYSVKPEKFCAKLCVLVCQNCVHLRAVFV